jgi:hypothetical protein
MLFAEFDPHLERKLAIFCVGSCFSLSLIGLLLGSLLTYFTRRRAAHERQKGGLPPS